VPAGGSTVNIIGAFNDTDGEYPMMGVTMTPDGFLVGAAYDGGPDSVGTVYKF
jgi:hypothetical protein